MLTPLTTDERALLLREAEAAYASNKVSQSLFWLRLLCKCANRKEEIALHGRRHDEFKKSIGTKIYQDPVAAVDAQGSRLRRELEKFPTANGRVVTLVPGEWGLAWKTIAPVVKPANETPWEMFATATGKIHFVIPSTEYFPVVNQLLLMKLAPNAQAILCDGKESPLLEPADVLVAVGTPDNNAAIAELAITGNEVHAIALPDACGALVIPASSGREGLALLRRAIRAPHREGMTRARAAV